MMDSVEAVEPREPAALGHFFARFIAEQSGETEESLVARTAAWLSGVQSVGDVCLDLRAHAQKPWFDQQGNTPALEDWREALLKNACVAEPPHLAPMILDAHRLYLYRFWRAEDTVGALIQARLQQPLELDMRLLQSGLTRLFASFEKEHEKDVDWQKVAAALAVMRSFAVISGGPGTGKTASLVRVLVLLLEQNPNMRIRLAAPTGKAAARMVESIRSAKQSLETDASVRDSIPDEAATLHRLLGYSPRGYRYHQDHPLMIDCLVMDEASMLDLTMMARVLEALPKTARLILLGDRDQLASVDAGNVLGDITGHGHPIAYGAAMVKQLADLTAIDAALLPQAAPAAMPPVADAIALLRKSYRFDENSRIGQLAKCVNQGDDVAQALRLLEDDSSDEVIWQANVSLDALLAQMGELYTPYLREASVEKAMALFEKQRFLCAVRRGKQGVEQINQSFSQHLMASGLLAHGDMVQGMPVMVTGNNYELNLFNGDVGLLWCNAEGKLRAYFRQADGSLRAIPAQSLPAYELAWAMTVHKSQGSEFDHVLLLLPDAPAGQAILTRELLYTAITRAKKHLTLYGSKESVQRAMGTKVERHTGLSNRLGW